MNYTIRDTLVFLLMAILFFQACKHPAAKTKIGLTLIPPAVVTNKVDLDVRAGITNPNAAPSSVTVKFYLDKEFEKSILFDTTITIPGHTAQAVAFLMPTQNKLGKHKMVVTAESKDFEGKETQDFEIVASNTRSNKAIGGAWISFYHWSETEGKMWNPAIKNLTDEQWKEMIGSMHKIGMDIVVIQESFRNQEYVGKHNMDTVGYKGKAFYPSQIFPSRMPIAAKDPVEAVLSEADQLGMHVFMGVGMYAWFDYTAGSLAWHKKVAKELWDLYGKHPSFYGFYVSEEGMGSLDCFETDPAKQIVRRKEVLDFFKSFTPFCKNLAPEKPVMFAPNGWGVGRANGAYDELLKNVDIITPFAFARMPEGDLTGPQAIGLLQTAANKAGAHLWLDLEAFLFNEKEGYLYPRPINEIKADLDLFSNFEKTICYQYPGVFNHPKASVRVGEAATVQLYKDYQAYLKKNSTDSIPKK